MLRNDYFSDYKEKNKFELENKYADDDDNYILKKHKPLADKAIAELPPHHLKRFVDEILTSKKVSKLLYASNASKEINLLTKSVEVLKKNGIRVNNKETPIKNNPIDIVMNRKKKEIIEMIKGEASQYKEGLNKQKNILNEKNEQFYYTIKTERREETNEFINGLNRNRIERFEKIFNSIKSKLDKTEHKLTTTNITYPEFFTNNKKVSLPDLHLNMNEVYSRLYHNVVYIQPKTEKKKIKNFVELAKKLDKNNKLGHNTDFIINNVIKSANGKEFTIKITDEILMQCFNKHSGGPTFQIDKVIIFYLFTRLNSNLFLIINQKTVILI